jgi:hypothetical protein
MSAFIATCATPAPEPEPVQPLTIMPSEPDPTSTEGDGDTSRTPGLESNPIDQSILDGLPTGTIGTPQGALGADIKEGVPLGGSMSDAGALRVWEEYKCGVKSRLIAMKELTRCGDAGCDDNTCCEARPRNDDDKYCNDESFKCYDFSYPKDDGLGNMSSSLDYARFDLPPDEIRCESSGCTAALCCEVGKASLVVFLLCVSRARAYKLKRQRQRAYEYNSHITLHHITRAAQNSHEIAVNDLSSFKIEDVFVSINNAYEKQLTHHITSHHITCATQQNSHSIAVNELSSSKIEDVFVSIHDAYEKSGGSGDIVLGVLVTALILMFLIYVGRRKIKGVEVKVRINPYKQLHMCVLLCVCVVMSVHCWCIVVTALIIMFLIYVGRRKIKGVEVKVRINPYNQLHTCVCCCVCVCCHVSSLLVHCGDGSYYHVSHLRRTTQNQGRGDEGTFTFIVSGVVVDVQLHCVWVLSCRFVVVRKPLFCLQFTVR